MKIIRKPFQSLFSVLEIVLSLNINQDSVCSLDRTVHKGTTDHFLTRLKYLSRDVSINQR